MSFHIVITDDLKKIIISLKRRDRQTYQKLTKKILQIASSDEYTIQHYKNLRKPLQDYKRVHIGSYVLLFQVQNNTILFHSFAHHDDVYTIKQ